MKTPTSCFTKFDVQRNELKNILIALCKARSVDTTLAKQVTIALDMLDARTFDRIQRETLERFPEPGRNNSYLDFCQHAAKAMRLYLRFIEDSRHVAETPGQRRRILDIGSGSGAFCFLCNALGHHATGLDKPRCHEKDQLIPLNYQLTRWYNVDVIEHEIERMLTFPMEDLSFDDFVLFYPTFHNPWKEKDWDFFFSDLTRCATKNDSRVYVQISKPKIRATGEVHFSIDEFFFSIAKLDYKPVDDRGYVIRLT